MRWLYPKPDVMHIWFFYLKGEFGCFCRGQSSDVPIVAGFFDMFL